MSFWETFEDANTNSIETLGEDVTLDAVAGRAIVEEIAYEDSVSAGGRKAGIVAARILVGAAVALRDGMPVVLRGAAGKVNSWSPITPGGTRRVEIGGANRWSGQVPGM